MKNKIMKGDGGMSWEMVKLSSVAEIIAGQSPESKYYNQNGEGFPFFQGKADFTKDYPIVRYWCSQPTKISKPNDILLSVRAPVGPTNICNIEACIGRGLAAIRVSEKLDYKYLYFYLKSIEDKLSSQGNGSTFSAITVSVVKDIEIPLPPLSIQKRIAEILDAADALRRKDQELLRKYDELAQAIFIDMFGDPVKNEKGWEVKTIGESIDFMTSGSRGWAQYYTEEGDLFLRINNVGYNEMKLNDTICVTAPNNAESVRTQVKHGDILLSITADLGRTCVIPNNFPKAFINQHLAIIRLKNDYEPNFVSQVFASEYGRNQFKKLNKGGVKAGLNFEDIKSLEFINPPIELQNRYKVAITELYKQKIVLDKNLLATNKLFNSLLQQAFKGELVK